MHLFQIYQRKLIDKLWQGIVFTSSLFIITTQMAKYFIYAKSVGNTKKTSSVELVLVIYFVPSWLGRQLFWLPLGASVVD